MSATPVLPFDWNAHFIPDDSVDCFPACVAMAVRYWKSLRERIVLPGDIEFWKDFCEKCSASSNRGTSIRRLYNNMKLGTETLDGAQSKVHAAFQIAIDAVAAKSLDTLDGLLRNHPPIPAILIFDRTFMLTGDTEGSHAVLLHSYDRKHERVDVIDPSLPLRGRPSAYVKAEFEGGWRLLQNLTIIVHPVDIDIKSQTTSIAAVKSESLLDYIEANER